MVVKLRLKRLGKPKKPFYRVIAIDHRSRRDGKPIEILGYYNPLPKEKVINLKHDRVDYWLKQGAQASETVATLIKRSLKSLSKVKDASI